MVYRHLDPGRDWDAWCDDHPDPPEQDEIPEHYWYWACANDGDVSHDEVVFSKDGAVATCTICGEVCTNEGEYDFDGWLASLDEY